MQHVAIIGSGPTALYTLTGLCGAGQPLHITIFERSEISGTGGPYRPGDTDHLLLANIASIEIPGIGISYADWLRALPTEKLALFGIAPEDINERAFLPRVLLGAYFRDRMRATVDQCREAGHKVEVFAETRVVDIMSTVDGYTISALHDGGLFTLTVDRAVLATGHQWIGEDRPEDQVYASPWPSEKLTDLAPGRVGIMGTSLSGIDAAIAVASGCGQFDKTEGVVTYAPKSKDLRITLMSRKGLLPEADFYCPIPHEPLEFCTREALDKEARGSAEGRLDRIFALMTQEITQADPEYAKHIKLGKRTPDDFRSIYFAERLAADPMVVAADNLDEVTRNATAKRTSGYRYALLRMHEEIEPFVAQLSEADRKRFADGIAEVFIDNYAAVPPQTIERLLALHRAGCLEVLRLGMDYQCDTEGPEQGAVVTLGRKKWVFDAFVDARGQRALVLDDLPFPTLRRQLRQSARDGASELDLTDTLAMRLPGTTDQGLFCAAVPYLMHRFPFVQGVTACQWLGEKVSRALLDDLDAQSRETATAA